MKNKTFLILLFLVFTLQSSFAQQNTTTPSDILDNTTAVITEDSLVGEKLEQVQNRSNMSENMMKDLGQKTNERVIG